MPLNRRYPHGAENLSALDQDRWAKQLSLAEKVAVYWPSEPGSVTLVGYYSTVSSANTAARAAIKANGALPRVEINWAHSTISHIQAGPAAHPDAREDLPSWIDAEPLS